MKKPSAKKPASKKTAAKKAAAKPAAKTGPGNLTGLALAKAKAARAAADAEAARLALAAAADAGETDDEEEDEADASAETGDDDDNETDASAEAGEGDDDETEASAEDGDDEEAGDDEEDDKTATSTNLPTEAAAERKRIAGILRSDAAKGREAAAMALAIDTEVTAKQAVGILKAIPVAKAGGSLTAQMRNLGRTPVAPGGGAEATSEDAIAKRIASA